VIFVTGINDFMLSTHIEAPSLLSAMRVDANLGGFSIIPAVPYLHRINGMVASKGIFHAGISSISYPAFFSSILRLRGTKVSALYAFIEREISVVRNLGFEVKNVALQNIFVDLLISLDLAWVLNGLNDLMSKRGYGIVPITMNPLIADRVLSSGIPMCTHYNYLGYLVQPSLEDFCLWMQSVQRPVWAMGVMASGVAKLDRVFCDPVISKFDSIVFGSSRPESVRTFGEKYAAYY
jgi:hypothetical protein